MTAARVIPTLPAEYETSPVEWTRWMPAPILSHVDSGCWTCDYEGPLSLAFGFCVDGPVRIKRLLAVRCRRCQETRVSTFRPFRFARMIDGRVVFGEQVEVAYFPPQALGEDL